MYTHTCIHVCENKGIRLYEHLVICMCRFFISFYINMYDKNNPVYIYMNTYIYIEHIQREEQ